MRRIPLAYGPRQGWVCLRELRGRDEELVTGTETHVAVALLDGLLVAATGAVLGPGQAARLTAPDRDRLLADVHIHELGTRIDSTIECSGCASPFDLDFRLDQLLAAAKPSLPAGISLEDGGEYRLADGRRFRVPTGEDELACASAADPERELLNRVMREGSAHDDPEPVLAALRDHAPLLDTDLAAGCPECGLTQAVHFDIQHYLLSRLEAEAAERTLEIHRLARAYAWSLGEILDLPRSRRRRHVWLIEREEAVR